MSEQTWAGIKAFQLSTFTFDGRQFDGLHNPHLPWGLYLAHKARCGDAVAVEVLTAMRITITDADGKSYWPMASGETVEVPEHMKRDAKVKTSMMEVTQPLRVVGKDSDGEWKPIGEFGPVELEAESRPIYGQEAAACLTAAALRTLPNADDADAPAVVGG